MAGEMGYELDRTDPEFEHVRVAALRTFDVQLESGLWLPVTAHNLAEHRGVLSFITICADGRIAPESFNAGAWRCYRETTTDAQRDRYREVADHVIMARAERQRVAEEQDALLRRLTTSRVS